MKIAFLISNLFTHHYSIIVYNINDFSPSLGWFLQCKYFDKFCFYSGKCFGL